MGKVEDTFSISDGREGNLIGEKGRVKRRIEEACNVRLRINDGVVTVRGDSLNVMRAGNIIRAIDFGFPADDALLLENPNNQLQIFDMHDVLPATQVRRVIARVIGERGKAKLFLEGKLGLKIVVRDGRVGAIGDPLRIEILREALDRFASGATHTSIYKHVERRLALLENL